MAFYLNQSNDLFKINLNNKIYVDKSNLIRKTNDHLLTDSRFLCVTRPRRFGKTMALSMLNAYYSKGCDSNELFNKLNISDDQTYLTHLNKHNVIWVDMAGIYADSKNNFLNELVKYIIRD